MGEETWIWQGGANNTTVLGGAGIGAGMDFSTGSLDIYTGGGGGGFVYITNTTDQFGSFFPRRTSSPAGAAAIRSSTMAATSGRPSPWVPSRLTPHPPPRVRGVVNRPGTTRPVRFFEDHYRPLGVL